MQLQMLNPINNVVPTVAASFVIFQSLALHVQLV